MSNVIKRYFLAMLIGIVVSVGLIVEADEFANPNMFKVGIVIVFFYFIGLTALVIDEIRRGR